MSWAYGSLSTGFSQLNKRLHRLLECVLVGVAPPPAYVVFGFEEGYGLWLAIRDFDEADVYPPVVPFLSSAGHYHVDLAWKNDHLYARLWQLLNTLGRVAPSPVAARARMRAAIDAEDSSAFIQAITNDGDGNEWRGYQSNHFLFPIKIKRTAAERK